MLFDAKIVDDKILIGIQAHPARASSTMQQNAVLVLILGIRCLQDNLVLLNIKGARWWRHFCVG